MHFYRKVSSGKTGLPFQNPTYSREFFRGTRGKRVNQNPEFLSSTRRKHIQSDEPITESEMLTEYPVN